MAAILPQVDGGYMRKTLLVSGALALVGSTLPAQTVRWNDRPTATWAEEAPRVRLYIDGSPGVSIGAPVRLRFEVDDNAYVTVVRVDDHGRMTILFPYTRNQRASVRGDMVHYVRSPRLGGDAAFLATDRMGGGYVFAIASYAPLDFSSFENRDYDRIGGYSEFTLANRSIARRPDVFIDRFAATVLWDRDTPYDYDVVHYFTGGPAIMNAYALCSAMYGQFGSQWYRTALLYDWDNFGYAGYPYSSMCRGYYQRAYCFSFLALYSSAFCNFGTQVVLGPTSAPPVGGQPTDSTGIPNEGVVRGGLFTPTPVPVPADPPPMEGRVGRFDEALGDEFDGLKSIPARATKKMKDDDARRAREAAAGAPARTDFSAADEGKPDKVRTASADTPARVQPPAREPTRAKGASEPRRDKRGFGSTVGRTSEPRNAGRDRVSRPVDTRTTGASPGSTANPPSIRSAPTGEKKKPPM